MVVWYTHSQTQSQPVQTVDNSEELATIIISTPPQSTSSARADKEGED